MLAQAFDQARRRPAGVADDQQFAFLTLIPEPFEGVQGLCVSLARLHRAHHQESRHAGRRSLQACAWRQPRVQIRAERETRQPGRRGRRLARERLAQFRADRVGDAQGQIGVFGHQEQPLAESLTHPGREPLRVQQGKQVVHDKSDRHPLIAHRPQLGSGLAGVVADQVESEEDIARGDGDCLVATRFARPEAEHPAQERACMHITGVAAGQAHGLDPEASGRLQQQLEQDSPDHALHASAQVFPREFGDIHQQLPAGRPGDQGDAPAAPDREARARRRAGSPPSRPGPEAASPAHRPAAEARRAGVAGGPSAASCCCP